MSETQSRAKDEPVDMPSQRETETLPPRHDPAGALDQFPTIDVGPALVDDAGTQPAVPGYEILAELGRGGMGVVYKARQITLNRPVALKMILAGEFADAAARQRFLAEAEAIARLQHPHIVQVYEFSTFGQKPYFALEYVAGGSLAQKLAGTPQQPRYAAELVEKLARAIQAAHDKGIVHRDLKPANVLLTETDEPKITDFGLAKQFDATNPDRKGGEGLTATGAVLGTPSYMAPEQAGGNKTIGPTADIYALGAILYEMLTGRPPFKAATPLDTILQVVSEEPVPPSQLIAKTPRDLETICLKCLQKEPAKRYGSAEGLGDDLRAFLDGRPIRARPVGRMERTWRWCRRNPVGAALLLSLVIGTGVAAGLAIWALVERDRADSEAATAKANETLAKDSDAEAKKSETRAKDQEDVAKQNAARARRQTEASQVTNGLKLEGSNDVFGALLWFAKPLDHEFGPSESELSHRLRLSNYWRHSPRPVLVQCLFNREKVYHAAFSPDGRLLVTASADRTARLWNVATGQPHGPPLQHEGGVFFATFSPDGRQVATASADRTARVWDSQTGLPATPPLKHQGPVQRAGFSPDGRRLITAGQSDPRNPNVIPQTLVWDVPNGQLLRSFGPERGQWKGYVGHVGFSTDGSRAVLLMLHGGSTVWDTLTGQPAPREESMPPQTPGYFSHDGKRNVMASRDLRSTQVTDVKGQPVTPPLEHRDSLIHAAFSPDSRRVVTTSRDKTACVWDAQSGQLLAPPLPHPAAVHSAAFSSDGRRLVTVSGAQEHFESEQNAEDGRRLVADRGAQVRVWEFAQAPASVPLPHGDLVGDAKFSGDSRRVVTASWDKSARVWDVATGLPLTPPLEHDGHVHRAAFSPDGRLVVTGSADRKVRVWDAVNGRLVHEPLPHVDFVASVAFSPSGRHVLSSGGPSTRVWYTGTWLSVFPPIAHGRSATHASYSPDGKRFLTVVRENELRVWDAATGKPVTPVLIHELAVRRLGSDTIIHAAFSPDSRHVVSASAGKTVRFWNAETGEETMPPLHHEDIVNWVEFDHDGKRLVTASGFSVRVWSAQQGTPLSPRLVHDDVVAFAAFAWGDRAVITRGQWGARLWDARSGQPLSPPLRHPPVTASAALSPDSRWLLLGGSKDAQLWNVGLDDRPNDDWIQITQLLYGHALDQDGALQPLSDAQLQRLWEKVRANHPDDCAVPIHRALAWHRREAEACVQEENPAAALFHTLHACNPAWAVGWGMPRW